MATNCTKVYVCQLDEVKVGKGLVGWNSRTTSLVVTTPIVSLERTEQGLSAVTEENGHYFITNRR